MAIRSVWREWDNEDGTRCAILLFPEKYTEEQALEEVGIERGRLVKTGEQQLAAEATRMCEYHVLGREAEEQPRT